MNALTSVLLDPEGPNDVMIEGALGADSVAVHPSVIELFERANLSISVVERSRAGGRLVRLLASPVVSILDISTDGMSGPTAVMTAAASGPALFLAALNWSTQCPTLDPFDPSGFGSGEASITSVAHQWNATVTWRIAGELIATQSLVGMNAPAWWVRDSDGELTMGQFSMRTFVGQLAGFLGQGILAVS